MAVGVMILVVIDGGLRIIGAEKQLVFGGGADHIGFPLAVSTDNIFDPPPKCIELVSTSD